MKRNGLQSVVWRASCERSEGVQHRKHEEVLTSAGANYVGVANAKNLYLDMSHTGTQGRFLLPALYYYKTKTARSPNDKAGEPKSRVAAVAKSD